MTPQHLGSDVAPHSVHEEIISIADLRVEAAQIARRMGYSPASDRATPPNVAQIIEQAIAQAQGLIEPRGVWRVAVVLRCDSEEFELEHGVVLAVGALVGSQLRRSEALAVFVVTIGPRLEQAARGLIAAGNGLEGFVLDAIGSSAVEASADLLETRIAEAASRRGWRITNRFSPGYCTWATADQQALFSTLPHRAAGVTLSASALMHPLKSVSGVIGLGQHVERRDYPCDICGIEDCTHRLVKSRGH